VIATRQGETRMLDGDRDDVGLDDSMYGLVN
jgi:hypothetical protein